MYERKIPVDLDCPLRLTMSLIGSKWKSCILDELRYKPLRPSELHKLFPEAAPRVLDHFSRIAASFRVRHYPVGRDIDTHYRCHDSVGQSEYPTFQQKIFPHRHPDTITRRGDAT